MKGDVDFLDEVSGSVSIEVKDSNHPDIWSVEGIARALRGYLGKKPTTPPKLVGQASHKILVDKRVREVRPYIACAVVKRVSNSDETLKGWIGLQDRLDQTYGRKRKKASIGFYQADLVKSPISYTVANPRDTSFVPLGSEDRMSLAEIVEKHPKGIEYGPIISPFKEWPLLVDGQGKVLSLPPVINSHDLGKVTSDTKNILVEVTGTGADVVNDTLKIVVTALSDRGGRIYSCQVEYPYGTQRKIVTPNLASKEATLSVDYVNELLGTNLTPLEVARLLRRASYTIKSTRGNILRLGVPCYRLDIMHQVDLVEDVAIALDVNEVDPEWPQVWTPGGLTVQTDSIDMVAEVMVGLGFQEILTYSLTSRESLEGRMNSLPPKDIVELRNPKMSTLTCLRNWLLPSLMEFLSNNTHVDYPQKLFEIGTCARPEGHSIGQVSDMTRLSAVTVHANAGFTEIRACLDALLNNVGVDFKVTPWTHPTFLEGRCGEVSAGEEILGVIGELHPRVLKSWGLNLPAAGFELEISPTRFANRGASTSKG